MDAHPPHRAAHQRQQPDPYPTRHRQTALPGLPEPVVQQAPQPARRAGQYGLSQVRSRRGHDAEAGFFLSFRVKNRNPAGLRDESA